MIEGDWIAAKRRKTPKAANRNQKRSNHKERIDRKEKTP